MPRLSNILNDSDEMVIPTPDGDLTIEYYPSKLTPKLRTQIQHYVKAAEKVAEDEEKQKELLNKVYDLLLSFFASWDLEDEFPCGKCEACIASEECRTKKIDIVPLSAESLDNLPDWMLEDIVSGFIGPNHKAPQKRRKKN